MFDDQIQKLCTCVHVEKKHFSTKTDIQNNGIKPIKILSHNPKRLRQKFAFFRVVFLAVVTVRAIWSSVYRDLILLTEDLNCFSSRANNNRTMKLHDTCLRCAIVCKMFEKLRERAVVWGKGVRRTYSITPVCTRQKLSGTLCARNGAFAHVHTHTHTHES